jgi:thiol-disulfide isomerase/thioredoxin
MMNVKVFGKPGCEYCKTTMKKFETFLSLWKIQEKLKLSFFDMETVDGLAEGAFLGVIKIPTSIIEKDGSVVARWDGKVPLSEEVKPVFEDLTTAS